MTILPGGGGTFVYVQGDQLPLIVAGGGGGASYAGFFEQYWGQPGRASIDGGDAFPFGGQGNICACAIDSDKHQADTMATVARLMPIAVAALAVLVVAGSVQANALTSKRIADRVVIKALLAVPLVMEETGENVSWFAFQSCCHSYMQGGFGGGGGSQHQGGGGGG